MVLHDDVIKWKHFPRYWPFVRGIHLSAVNSHTKASDAEHRCFLWSAPWLNGWVNNREAGDLRRHRGHYDVIVISSRHDRELSCDNLIMHWNSLTVFRVRTYQVTTNLVIRYCNKSGSCTCTFLIHFTYSWSFVYIYIYIYIYIYSLLYKCLSHDILMAVWKTVGTPLC